MSSRLRLVSVLCLSASALSADVVPAPPFTEHAVLQRDMALPVWGTAAPGEAVTVTFGGHARSTRAGADGRWAVELPALPANATPAVLEIAGSNKITLRDILVGEVWLASGQSNMEMAMGWGRVRDAKAEIAAANFPLIRELRVAKTVADTPRATAAGAWRVCGPGAVGNFSAVAYFFARDLHRKIDVPVGILHASWGGSLIEAWISGPSLAADPGGAATLKRWSEALATYPARKAAYDAELVAWEKAKAAAAAEGREFRAKAPAAPVGPGHYHTRSGLYNAMIHPLAPAAFRGVIWYQGESNVGRHDEYRTLFPTLIKDWRATFGRPEMPFLWVQLPNFAGGNPSGQEWARLREAQAQALALPRTGQAVTIDIGEAGDIHPANKQDVGRRLALLALARVYGDKTARDSGPALSSAEAAAGAARLRFAHAEGLHAADAAVTGFEIAGADKQYVPAEAVLEPEGVVRVSAPSVAAPRFVRYLFSNAPRASLRNAAGLPAAPFQAELR